MKGISMSFDHQPDPVLGAALRQALSAEDHSTFVARVMAAAAAPHLVHWDVLAHWARRSAGAGAVCAAVFGAGLLVGAMRPTPMDLVTPIADPSAHALVATGISPHASVLLEPEGQR